MTARSYMDSILTTVVLPVLSSAQLQFIIKTTLLHILCDFPNVVFKDMTYSQFLPSSRPLAGGARLECD